MIVPNKNIRLQNSLLDMGAQVLTELRQPQTVSSLWERAKTVKEINSYDKFVLTLDFLFMMNLVESKDGLVLKAQP